jgi:hypothetical protein
MKLQTLEVSLELAHLHVVSIDRVLFDVARLVDLIDEDLGVAVSNKPLDSQGNNNAQFMDQDLVLGAIVGLFVVDLQDVF